MRILTSQQIKDVESRAFQGEFTEKELMLDAGLGCAQKIIERYGDDIYVGKVAVVCGNGKNAGDGFVIANRLSELGVTAYIVLADKRPTIPEPKYYFDKLQPDVQVLPFSDRALNGAALIVDCVFGIGFHGALRPPFDKVINAINQRGVEVVSVDTPSGTDSATGALDIAVKADYTIAISTLKFAHVLPPSNGYCGKVDVIDIGIPESCYTDEYVQSIDLDFAKSVIPHRDFNANKGSTGHLLNICGSYLMPGAAVICAMGAIRSGAGLVKCLCPKSAYPLIAAHLKSPVFEPVAECDGMLASDVANSLSESLKWANAVAIGCGMGVSEGTRAVTAKVIKDCPVPIIIDADGINCLTDCIDILQDRSISIITPHPGEMARLMDISISDVQSDRVGVAVECAKKLGAIVVLKGANTIVTDGKRVMVNTTGNPGLAMGGTGDLLTGVIASLVSQGVSPFEAAAAGVFIHSFAADRAVECMSLRGITVDDIALEIALLMSEFE